MKVAFPVKDNNGLESVLDSHFGTAKQFLIVDMETQTFETQENQKLASGEAKCKTSVFQGNDKIDMVVTKCMGDGSQRSLHESDIKIFQAQKDSVLENIDLLKEDKLKLFHIFDICQNKKNKKEGGCGHHH